MKEISYSIIIPHKNIPKLLQRCLDSIPTREDTEIIVVDDNSDKDIVDFSHFPGAERKDTTIIFNKQSKGAGHARNLGLNIAKGKKILFADSDDFFSYCFNDILDKYKTDKHDIVFFNCFSLDSTFFTPSKRGSHLNNMFLEDVKTGLMKMRYTFGEPWCKLINHDLIKRYHILFDETPKHNDTTFSYLCGFYGESFACDQHAIYCNTFREASISLGENREAVLSKITVFSKKQRFFHDHNIPIKVTFHVEELYRLWRTRELTLFKEGIEIYCKYGFKKKNLKWIFLKIYFKHIRFRILNSLDKWTETKIKVLN